MSYMITEKDMTIYLTMHHTGYTN